MAKESCVEFVDSSAASSGLAGLVQPVGGFVDLAVMELAPEAEEPEHSW